MSLENEVAVKKQELVKITIANETQKMIRKFMATEPNYVESDELTDLGNELAAIEWTEKRLNQVARATMDIVERNCTLTSYTHDNSHPPVFITELGSAFYEHVNT